MDEPGYPVRYTVIYQERASRLTTFFRLFMAIPHAIVLALFEIAAFVLVVLAWFAILFTGRFPRGMFGFVERTLRYAARLNSYVYLLTDRWPAFGGGEPGDGYPVEFRVEYPERLSRLTTLFRMLMVIPAGIVAYVLNIVGQVVSFVAWFAILFTGRLPRGMFDVILFCYRFNVRVSAYGALVTDRYPWFQPEAGARPPPAAGSAPCPSCGAVNAAGAAFCANCGEPLPG
jgi:Domain of unknown function (DUF4389)/zinc-ribbon domain